jgi:DNA-binding IclR family transcriptional regulator
LPDLRLCVNDQQSTLGLVAIAVPVRNQRGEHVATLGMVFPQFSQEGRAEALY